MVGFCDEKVHWLGPLNKINELRFPCFKTMLLHKSPFSSYATTCSNIMCTGKWPSIPYTGLCVYACRNLNVHAKPEKSQAIKSYHWHSYYSVIYLYISDIHLNKHQCISKTLVFIIVVNRGLELPDFCFQEQKYDYLPSWVKMT